MSGRTPGARDGALTPLRFARCFAIVLLVTVACHSAPKPVPQETLSPGSVEILRKALTSFRGKPVVVNYWATWCIPCRAEMPRIVAAAARYGSAVRFLGVDVEDDTKTAEDFARQRAVQYPMVSDTQGAIRSAEHIVGLPVTQFYRADGQLAFVNNGEIQDADLKKRIDELLVIGRPVAS